LSEEDLFGMMWSHMPGTIF